MSPVTTGLRNVTRALRLSLALGVLGAVMGVAFGVLSGSGAILLDGLFSSLSLGTTWLGLAATRLVREPENERFQFGYRHLEPMAVALRAFALLAVCLYAVAEAVMSIVRGGQAIDNGWVLAYAVFSLVEGLAVWAWERRLLRSTPSAALRLDAQEWLFSTLLSCAILVGWGVATWCSANGQERLGQFIDPLLVMVIAVVVAPVPLRMLPRALRDVLLIAPEPEVQARFAAAVTRLAHAHGYQRWKMHLARMGDGFDLEVNLLVEPGHVTPTAELDRLRAELAAELELPRHRLWMSVTATADERWA